jgi:hypothetical protein
MSGIAIFGLVSVSAWLTINIAIAVAAVVVEAAKRKRWHHLAQLPFPLAPVDGWKSAVERCHPLLNPGAGKGFSSMIPASCNTLSRCSISARNSSAVAASLKCARLCESPASFIALKRACQLWQIVSTLDQGETAIQPSAIAYCCSTGGTLSFATAAIAPNEHTTASKASAQSFMMAA